MDDIDILKKEIDDLNAQLEETDTDKGQIYDRIAQLQGRISEIKVRRFLEGIRAPSSFENDA